MDSTGKPWFKNWPVNVPNSLHYPQIPLFEILNQTAAAHPQKVAIAYAGAEITYAELNSLCDQFAAALSDDFWHLHGFHLPETGLSAQRTCTSSALKRLP